MINFMVVTVGSVAISWLIGLAAPARRSRIRVAITLISLVVIAACVGGRESLFGNDDDGMCNFEGLSFSVLLLAIYTAAISSNSHVHSFFIAFFTTAIVGGTDRVESMLRGFYDSLQSWPLENLQLLALGICLSVLSSLCIFLLRQRKLMPIPD